MDEIKNESGQTASKVRAISTVIIFAVIAVVVFLMAKSTPSTKSSDAVWDEGTTYGEADAANHFIMYTDIMCPYCDYFSRAIMASQDEFEQYLAENDILFELRVTDFLWEYNGVSEYSTQSAEATYCAGKEGKFWDYYHAVLTALNEDYHSQGIGNAKGAPMITDITDDYWLNIGHEVGLSSDFDTCYNTHEMLPKVQENTEKTAKDLTKYGQGGLPFFHFGDFVTTGFDPSWDWEYVQKYFDAGLSKA